LTYLFSAVSVLALVVGAWHLAVKAMLRPSFWYDVCIWWGECGH